MTLPDRMQNKSIFCLNSCLVELSLSLLPLCFKVDVRKYRMLTARPASLEPTYRTSHPPPLEDIESGETRKVSCQIESILNLGL